MRIEWWYAILSLISNVVFFAMFAKILRDSEVKFSSQKNKMIVNIFIVIIFFFLEITLQINLFGENKTDKLVAIDTEIMFPVIAIVIGAIILSFSITKTLARWIKRNPNLKGKITMLIFPHLLIYFFVPITSVVTLLMTKIK